MSQLIMRVDGRYGGSPIIDNEIHRRYYSTAFNSLRAAFPAATPDAIVDATQYGIGEWYTSAPTEVCISTNKSRNWIIQVARRSLMHELRREKRYTMLPDMDHDDADPQTQMPPGLVEDTTSSVIGDLLVEGLFMRLPPATADAMRLHVIDGFTVKEIAAIQGCSPNTVKKRLKGGYAKLRDIVRKERCYW